MSLATNNDGVDIAMESLIDRFDILCNADPILLIQIESLHDLNNVRMLKKRSRRRLGRFDPCQLFYSNDYIDRLTLLKFRTNWRTHIINISNVLLAEKARIATWFRDYRKLVEFDGPTHDLPKSERFRSLEMRRNVIEHEIEYLSLITG